jgi:hypothetical protein
LYDVNPPPTAIKFYKTVHECKKGVIAALSDPLARLENRADLPHEDVSGPDLLAPKPLYSAALGIGIPAVAARSLTFLMCHFKTPKALL